MFSRYVRMTCPNLLMNLAQGAIFHGLGGAVVAKVAIVAIAASVLLALHDI